MNTKTSLLHAALACGLAVAGTSLAQVPPPGHPSGMTAEQREAYRAQRQAEMAAMTAEQRAAAQAGRGQGAPGAGRQGQGQGTMARDGTGAGGQHGKAGGMRQGR